MVTSVAMRCRLGRRSCWLVRLQPTPFGTYLCPNFSFAWQSIVVLFLIFLQVGTCLPPEAPPSPCTLTPSSRHPRMTQANIWQLYCFSRGGYHHSSFFTEVLVWMGYVLAALTATWGLACARCLELATGGDSEPRTRDPPRKAPFCCRPALVNSLFPGLFTSVVVSTFVWAGLTDRSYTRMLAAFAEARAGLARAAAEAGTVSGDELAALRAGAVEVVQAGLDRAGRFVWFFSWAFVTCAAYTLLIWVVSRLRQARPAPVFSNRPRPVR